MTGGLVCDRMESGHRACNGACRNDDRNLRHFQLLSCFAFSKSDDDSEPRKSIAERDPDWLSQPYQLGGTAITPITSPGYRLAERVGNELSLFVQFHPRGSLGAASPSHHRPRPTDRPTTEPRSHLPRVRPRVRVCGVSTPSQTPPLFDL
jgi:hypothetical protein